MSYADERFRKGLLDVLKQTAEANKEIKQELLNIRLELENIRHAIIERNK